MTDPGLYDYRVAELKRAVDGDTYDLRLTRRVDYGFYLVEEKSWAMRFRLLGANTWEANEAGGAAATQAATAWIQAAIRDDVLRIVSHKTDNFGRWLGDLYRADTGDHLADHLAAGGHVKG